jgi:hypothetical protein
MGAFTLQLQQFAKKAAHNADLVVGKSVIGVAAEVDRRSPVGDASLWKSKPPKGYVGGRFRGNWQLGVNVVPTGETGAIDPAGAETQGRIIASIPEKASGKLYSLVNNAPYGQALEQGHSGQAPQGIVGLTVIRWQAIVDEAAGALAA